MSKWNKGLMATMEEFEEAQQSAVTGVNSAENDLLEITNSSREIQEVQSSIEEAIEGAEDLEAISNTLDENGSSESAGKVAEIAVESIYNRLGISRRVPSLESFRTRKAVVSLEGVISTIWEAIKKAVSKVIEMVKNFFSWVASFFKKTESKVEAQKQQVRQIEQQTGKNISTVIATSVKVARNPPKPADQPSTPAASDGTNTEVQQHKAYELKLNDKGNIVWQSFFQNLTVNANFDEGKLDSNINNLFDLYEVFSEEVDGIREYFTSGKKTEEYSPMGLKVFFEYNKVFLGELEYNDANGDISINQSNVDKAKNKYEKEGFPLASQKIMDHVWSVSKRNDKVTKALEKSEKSLNSIQKYIESKQNGENNNSETMKALHKQVSDISKAINQILVQAPKAYGAAVAYVGESLNIIQHISKNIWLNKADLDSKL